MAYKRKQKPQSNTDTAATTDAAPANVEETDLSKWERVRVPTTWTPEIPGEAIEGTYDGQHERGARGKRYTGVLINTPDQLWFVAGVVITSIVETVALPVGKKVRIVFTGWKDTNIPDRNYRMYDIFMEKEGAKN